MIIDEQCVIIIKELYVIIINELCVIIIKKFFQLHLFQQLLRRVFRGKNFISHIRNRKAVLAVRKYIYVNELQLRTPHQRLLV